MSSTSLSAPHIPLQPFRLLASNPDWLASLTLSAKTAATQCVPFPYFQNVFETAVLLLETIKKAKKNQDDFKELCQTAVEIVIILQNQLSLHQDVAALTFRDMCEELDNLLQDVIVVMKKLQTAHSFHGQVKEIFKLSSIAEQIPEYEKNIRGLCSRLKRRANVQDATIHNPMLGQSKDSEILSLYVSGGQEGKSRVQDVQGHAGSRGESLTLNYDIKTEHFNLLNHTNPRVVEACQIFTQCPPPSSIFHGRRIILEEMHQCFAEDTTRQHIYVLHGLGGAGKTQIALKFLQDTANHFTDRFFVDASTTNTIETGLRNIATAKEIGNSSQDVVKWLATKDEEWVLFFDGADDPQIDLNKFFPKCNHGNIIITSRHCFIRDGTHSRVSDMTESDAVALLLKSAGQETSLVNTLLPIEIVEAMWYFPLAIIQAGAFISKSGTFDTYLALYNEHREQLLSKSMGKSYHDYAWTVHTTWQISFNKLSPLAAMLLQLCSFLHPDGISEDIFHRAASYLIKGRDKSEYKPEKLSQMLDFMRDQTRRLQSSISPHDGIEKSRKFLSQFFGPTGEWDSVCFSRVINEIKAYSLLNFDPRKKMFSIHPLVQGWSRATLTAPDSYQACMHAILGMSIAEIFEEDMELASLTLLAHVDHLLQAAPKGPSSFELHYAIIYHYAGRYNDAKALTVSTLEKHMKHFGPNHLDTVHAMDNLAVICDSLGEFEEAKKLKLAVLENQKKLLGEEHLDTLHTVQSLAGSYNQLGNFEETKKLELIVLEKLRKLYGDEDLDTIHAMDNLATTYGALGQFEAVEKLLVVVLEKRRKLLGEEHLDTLSTRNHLAAVYSHLNNS
ncbi:hypothetical protein K438DRAFT_1844922 [Mycena galopus ATCC 62051]|nr:hypothetical protein K438DRAFT_1844922 [Mycena galopus ATCC 62051]